MSPKQYISPCIKRSLTDLYPLLFDTIVGMLFISASIYTIPNVSIFDVNTHISLSVKIPKVFQENL